VFCASHGNTEELAGKYFFHCKPVRRTKEANSPETARRLWEVNEEWMKGLKILKAEASKENVTEWA
jgi:WW domain-containing oxidoreductase